MEEERRQEEEGGSEKLRNYRGRKQIFQEREKAWLERWTILVVTYFYLFGP